MAVRVRFGPYELFPDSGELCKNGTRLRLPRQVLQVLVALVSNPGGVVSRDELQQKLWPGVAFGDFDHGLNSAVNRLREALCDSATDPKYIETIPGRGYRFIGSVEPSSRLLTALPAKDLPRGVTLNWRTTVVLFVGMASLATVLLVWRPNQAPLNVNVVQVTSLLGHAFDPSFSPDGTQIVFASATGAGGPDLYIKAIGDEKVLQLTQPPGTSSCPEWSPDGRIISYSHRTVTASGEGERAIYLMTPLGGAKRKLRDVADSLGALSFSCFSSWSPDSRLLAFNDTPRGEASGIFIISPDGSSAQRLTNAPNGMFDAFPAFSPDEKWVAFVRNTDEGGNAAIYLVSIQGSKREEKQIATLARIGRLAWTADSKRIVFDALGFFKGETFLYSVPVTGGSPERLQIVSSDGFHPTISRHGDRLAYSTQYLDSNIWKISLDGRAAPSKLISSSRIDMQPVFSPDGRKLLFVSNRDGTIAVWLSNVDGSDPARLSIRHGATPDWSPDGKYMVFDSNEGGRWQVFLKAIEGGPEVPITEDGFDHRGPSWSADGRSVYCSSNRTGTWEIWKSSVQTHEAVQITHGGGSYAQEARDGKMVYYQRPRSSREYDFGPVPEIWSVPADGGGEQLVVKICEKPEKAGLTWFWRVTGRGIYFVDNTTQPGPTLKYFDLRTRTVRKLRQLEKPEWGAPGLAISPDERTVLIGQIDDSRSDLMLVDHFH